MINSILNSRLKPIEIYPDARGVIERYSETLCRVTSVAKSTRANHYHKESAHLTFVADGMIEYYERNVDSKLSPKRFVLHAGHYFYTPAMVEHTMYFPVDTEFWFVSTANREQENYENDLVRFDESLRDIYWKTRA